MTSENHIQTMPQHDLTCGIMLMRTTTVLKCTALGSQLNAINSARQEWNLGFCWRTTPHLKQLNKKIKCQIKRHENLFRTFAFMFDCGIFEHKNKSEFYLVMPGCVLPSFYENSIKVYQVHRICFWWVNNALLGLHRSCRDKGTTGTDEKAEH